MTYVDKAGFCSKVTPAGLRADIIRFTPGDTRMLEKSQGVYLLVRHECLTEHVYGTVQCVDSIVIDKKETSQSHEIPFQPWKMTEKPVQLFMTGTIWSQEISAASGRWTSWRAEWQSKQHILPRDQWQKQNVQKGISSWLGCKALANKVL